LPARDALEGAAERYARVRAAGERLMAALDRTPGFKLRRIENGSNLAMLEIAPERQAGLEERLQKANVRLGKLNEGKVLLGFNESILRRDTDYLAKALAG
jgi:threonine aldolase